VCIYCIARVNKILQLNGKQELDLNTNENKNEAQSLTDLEEGWYTI
jgi:hypothetical protein